jgi:uncharacterized OB-fold protein
MTPGLPLSKCNGCGAVYFPARLICMKCSGTSWGEAVAAEGTVEQMTTVRHAAGRADWQPKFIANVRTDMGPMINVGLEAPVPDGTRVTLFDDNGAPRARKIGD